MSRRRKLIIAAAALAALVIAGVAGAVIRYTVITVGDGKWARLTDTDVYCQNTRTGAGRRTFVCRVHVPVPNANRTRMVRGDYGFYISETGIGVDRSTGPNTVHYFRYFNNP